MRKLWNEGWSFVKMPLGSTLEQALAADRKPVMLPHDWLIEQTDKLYEDGDGWYLKTLRMEETAGLPWVALDFDGVYMDADVLINGEVIRTHRYGYTPFFAVLSGKLREGDNEIAVHIRHQSPNSRWYSGAGIFRDVKLLALPAYHMVPDGFQVNTVRDQGAWLLSVEAELAGEGGEAPEMILRNEEGKILSAGPMEKTGDTAKAEWRLTGIAPWSVGAPNLYTLEILLGQQTETIKAGFRETEFTPDRGFFLNGEPVKLHGVCLHHDLGALGSAFYEKAAERQLRVMQEMGVNAIRTSHNPPARQLLDLCDRMGILVMDELYDMWELAKTTYDNARFFPETYPEDTAAWVRRDRCHPSVILWSIGNEIHDMQVSERGQMWTRLLMEEVRKHDARHARVTFASNYMPWEGAQKCADIIKLPGYNYAEKYYAAHHEQHPDWVIYGSETGSLLASRGIYHFPIRESILAEEDLQCSALLNSNTSWGALDIRRLLVDDMNTPYSLGQFLWSGIDYIGEPTPYHTRNCYFGQTDTACFPKDAYYFCQAVWTEKPMIHIGVYWDWNQGQLIDVPVMTNGAFAELLLNGKSLGKKQVDLKKPQDSLPVWQVPFEKGVLTARAYDLNGELLCETERASFGEAKTIRLSAEETVLSANCGDIAFIAVTVLDENGAAVENAVNRVHVSVSGGVLLGMDNGDSTDLDGYKTHSRRLFSGKLLLMVGAQEEGEIRIRVTGQGLEAAEITLPVLPQPEGTEKRVFPALCQDTVKEEEEWIRRIDIAPLSGAQFTPEHPEAEFSVTPLPLGARQESLVYRVVNAQGVDMPCAALEKTEKGVHVRALGDGQMYLRVSARNGYDHPRVLSSLEMSAEGFGPMGLNPYQFIAGALSDVREGEIGAGNEQGIAFARDGVSAAGFSNVDFGPVGSDEITLPVFALNDDLYQITLWDGMPAQGGRKIAVLPYQKKSIWNTYQSETYRLPEVLRGVHTLAFSMDCKIHLKGFSFTAQSRALRYNRALDADQMYGDSFTADDQAVKNIGNNVTLVFEQMAFEKGGQGKLILDGGTNLDTNTVSLRITNEKGDTAVSTCAFKKAGRENQAFSVETLPGLCTVAFVFLPGSQFDFYGFRFVEE